MHPLQASFQKQLQNCCEKFSAIEAKEDLSNLSDTLVIKFEFVNISMLTRVNAN
jgi:hypothetical protein